MTTTAEPTTHPGPNVHYSWGMDEAIRRAFRADHPDRDRTVFLAMRFDRHPLRERIQRSVREVGGRLRYDVVRADDRDYSDELWTNVRVCMEESALAVAVFETDPSEAPNLAFEIGYLLSRGVPCLILREEGLGPPAAMLAHRLHVPFSALDVEGTLMPAVERWLSARSGDGDN